MKQHSSLIGKARTIKCFLGAGSADGLDSQSPMAGQLNCAECGLRLDNSTPVWNFLGSTGATLFDLLTYVSSDGSIEARSAAKGAMDLNLVVGLSLGAGIMVGTWVMRWRTRGYALIDPELRSPFWRLRSPSFGPLLTKLSRSGRASACAEGVELSSHEVASADGATITVYVYKPEGIRTNSPAMFYTHGGGMITSSARGYHAIVSAYARELGIVMVSTEYRLAPEYPFPAPLDDIHAAYRWLVANAGTLGVDPAAIGAGGESAGGGLTAALCQRLRDLGEHAPVCQLLIYPMLDDRTTLRPARDYRGQLVWTEKSNMFGWSCYLGRKPALDHAPHYAAPSRTLDLSGLPPAWIGVGTLDLFHDEDVEYARRLRECGVSCELDVVEGAFHGFDLMGKSGVVEAFRGRILRFCRASLGGEAPAMDRGVRRA